ncbi:Alpha-galactosidase 2 [Escovopsis weberi]|uniref:Alpha-galactosidase n=1 Tax=Escovopsis weberi TaxID=150374 RepID=A0A0M9VWU1_ESCWE|nr:Alpha-galactosidase 2 [Escovopsis weberi]
MFGSSSSGRLLAALALTSGLVSVGATDPITVNGRSFALNGDNFSYRFHADDDTGDLILDHFGGPATEDGTYPVNIGPVQGWVELIGRQRREYPDLGRGDFRTPAVTIRQTAGYTVSEFQYKSHEVLKGKPALNGLPSTFGDVGDVSTLVVHMYDNYTDVAVDMYYSVFPKYDAIVRSVNITNHGKGEITVEKMASMSVDLPYQDFDMIGLRGDWARDNRRIRRKVDYGIQGHLHNPSLALVSPTTTESQGEAWGFNLIYTGSFSVEVEKGSQSLTRAMLGINPLQLSWPLAPGETLTSPECVAIFSNTGVGGMSRKFHRLYKNHLIRSRFGKETHPILLNSWEGLGFDYNATTIYNLAQETAALGAQLLVLDDGWFGVKYPRLTDNAALGDWEPNPERFPQGLPPFVDDVTSIAVANSSETLEFGLWFEPEMVSPNSSLYHEHPDWAIHAGSYPRTLTRNQLVLNVALPEVQEFIIESLSSILSTSKISYVKWDHNRGLHETPFPGYGHAYMLGMYHVFDTLTSRFPDIRWEGCASGGGRFDGGVLHSFPHIWTSDDTDGLERIFAQFGNSIFYPPSAQGAHISPVPNGNTGRMSSILFRAHVAMMGGSFGFELNPATLSDDDKAEIPGIIAQAKQVAPLVVNGEQWRLDLPEESNWPATMFISEDGSQAVLFLFQVDANIDNSWPFKRLQGLDPKAKYKVDCDQVFSGATLMNIGLQYEFSGDWQSRLVFLERQ